MNTIVKPSRGAVLSKPGRHLLSGVPEGLDALVLARLFSGERPAGTHLHIARDDARLAAVAEAFAFFAPEVEVVQFPAWDCLPYDRASPNTEVVGERVDALYKLASSPGDGPRLVLTTVNASLQRVPARETFRDASFSAAAGDTISLDDLTDFLVRNGYSRVGTVREPGEYALRGGIVDLFPPGVEQPVRLDFFGEELEGVRAFDPISQRTTDARDGVSLHPVSEVFLDDESIRRFRAGYRELFGAMGDDPLYAAISEGRKQHGMEHWLPLFHETLETLFDYLPDASVTLDDRLLDARAARLEMIADYYDARQTFIEARKGRKPAGDDETPPYRPLPPEMLYLDAPQWDAALADLPVGQFSAFSTPQGVSRESFTEVVDFGGRRVHDFAEARAKVRVAAEGLGDDSVFDVVRRHIASEQENGKKVLVTAFTAGSRERLFSLLAEHGVPRLVKVDGWPEAERQDDNTVCMPVFGLEHGFSSENLVFVGEQDIIGERLVRPSRKRRQAEAFIADAAELSAGDLVVHLDYGVGRYDGLETVVASGAPHDCLRLTYAGDDRLYVPVENVEVLSRYGSGDAGATLDRLGGANWQARKAKLKQRLRDMADELIQVAAARTLKSAEKITPAPGLYEEFCARFPYTETEDQERAIEETIADLSSGHAMDRLVCGDVGFGKTEIALRAAFTTVMGGGQVAVVAPTTLLARQHHENFRDRFAGLPVRIEQLSRLVTQKQSNDTKARLKSGETDIVIGTHALLSKGIGFRNLALLVIDEEQHFGVAHKERLKQLKADVHVLTLTATPIPRTLQMALTGVKEMSMIASPPVDRLAVRTFVLPYDPVVIREAIMREHFRGGQTFYVCPRISDLDEVVERLRELVPEVKIGIAHGRMPVRQLESVMTDFYEGRINLLLSTQIIESGLDIPTANTLVVHRSDMFGLAQLYQLRGRVGRSKLRAYCYLTLPPAHVLTTAAQKRLEVMQTLDSLGAGFTLASHDLDIRGAGNLLGEEQSGHIREVGVELYQQMLEEAVAEARGMRAEGEEEWVPQINVGIPVLIPDSYVADLDVRLGLYRRIAGLVDQAEIESFAAEMIDRFGALPEEVDNLFKIVAIKRLCRRAGVEKLDAGPKGAVVTFRDNAFSDPAGLVAFINDDVGRTKLRPDHRLVCRRDWERPAQRLSGAQTLMRKLAEIVA